MNDEILIDIITTIQKENNIQNINIDKVLAHYKQEADKVIDLWHYFRVLLVTDAENNTDLFNNKTNKLQWRLKK